MLPAIGPRDPHESHRVASPLELFTDLCYVVAIAQAALGLHHGISDGHPWEALGYFLIAFFAIWWAWLNFAWFNSAYDPDDVTHRVLTLLQVFGSLVLAAGVPRMFHGDFTLGVAGYVVMRVGLVLMWLRAAQGHPERRATALRYAGGIVAVQVGWVLGTVLTHGHPPFWVILAGVALDLAVPLVAERAGWTPWHAHHIAERYGLLFIIVLGETILSVTIALQVAFDEDHPPATLWLVVAGGVLITFTAWWLYFARDATVRLTGNDVSFVWGYGHYVVYGSIAALGAGLAARVDFHTHHSKASELVSAGWVTGPTVVFVVTLWVVCGRLHGQSPVPYAVAAAALVGATWLPVVELFTGAIVVALLVAVLQTQRDTDVAPAH